MYLATVDCAAMKPSLSNSPWMWGAPQSLYSRLMRRIKARNSAEIGGRPVMRPPASLVTHLSHWTMIEGGPEWTPGTSYQSQPPGENRRAPSSPPHLHEPRH